jgi:hypothetical protein
VLREVQIVVAGERDQALAVALDHGAVVASGRGKSPPEALGFKGRQLLTGESIKDPHVVSRLPWLVRGNRQGAPSPQTESVMSDPLWLTEGAPHVWRP